MFRPWPGDTIGPPPVGRVMSAHSSRRKGGAMQAEEARSLYERLGGAYSIAVVVDDFIDRIMGDSRLNANPRVDEAHHRVSPQGFKFYVTEQVCWAAGGPQAYSGRSMADLHRDLRISNTEWDAFMDDFDQTLRKFDVPARQCGELDAIIESTKDDIVTSGAPAA